MHGKSLIAAFITLASTSVALADDAPITPTSTEGDACNPCEAPAPSPPPAPPPAPTPPPPPPQTMYTPYVEPVPEKPSMYSYAWHDPTLTTGIGVAFQIGGGIGGFTDSKVNDISSSNIGGVWQFRSTIGSHTPLGVDLGYNGTAFDVQSFDGVTSDTLIGTDLEAALRWNILPHYAFNPYIFAGVGWQHYDLNNNTLTRADSGIGSSDDLAVFPMGVGLSWRDTSGLTAELRGTFRAAASSTLIEDANGNDASLHTWEASAGIGYEL